MRVVVTGASGNVGTSLLRSLVDEPAVDSVVGLARRRPEVHVDKVHWHTTDVSRDDLAPAMTGADAVVHLAWLLHPSHDEATQWATNVVGSRRVLHAAAAEGVSTVVVASSIGAYSPGPKAPPVTEDWPTDGVATSMYSRQKAYLERMCDAFEAAHPEVRVVRLRPALIMSPDAASGIRRLFAGPFTPTPVLRRFGVPVVPAVAGLALQVLHSADAGEAYRLALLRDVRGPFNLAADPVLDPPTLAEALDATRVPLPRSALRALVAAAWHLRLQPSEPGWIDLALGMPLLNSDRARNELGWVPRHRADATLVEFVAAVGRNEGLPTPPLDPRSSGKARGREITTGVGGSSR